MSRIWWRRRGRRLTHQRLSCAALAFDTQLSSPKAAVVSRLRVNDLLDVTTQVSGGATVVVALHKGVVAGGSASPLVQRLRECIEGGTAFTARVLSVDSGQIRVHVEAAKSSASPKRGRVSSTNRRWGVPGVLPAPGVDRSVRLRRTSRFQRRGAGNPSTAVVLRGHWRAASTRRQSGA